MQGNFCLAIYRELNSDPYTTKINKCIKISLSFHRGLFGLKLSPHPPIPLEIPAQTFKRIF